MSVARSSVLLLLLACAGCGGGAGYAQWDGRRGYDGNGDYGYDLAASRAEAHNYQAAAAGNYPVPGTPDDPWGPYIHEAAARFSVPEQWVRAVMRQESGGHEYDANGMPIVSSAGAMGLMQVMPQTYQILQQHYGLGGDPYAPRDNILAGTAYIREMYDRYGSPAFLAAYNAGPDRLDAYLAGGSPLPDETVNYLASVAPNLGGAVAPSGALAAFAGGSPAAPPGIALARTVSPDADRAYAGGGMVVQGGAVTAAADDPSDRAFDGGGLVTPMAPTGILTGRAEPAPQPMAPQFPAPEPSTPRPMLARASMLGGAGAQPAVAPASFAVVPVSATGPATGAGGWGIQVGAFPDPAISRAATAAARSRAGDLLAGTQPAITPVYRSGLLYRARLVGLSAANASAACGRLTGQGMDCFTVPPGS